MSGHLFASLVIEYTVFSLITVHMANILTIDHANLISVTRRSERMNARDPVGAEGLSRDESTSSCGAMPMRQC
jgi:hypothetical protein